MAKFVSGVSSFEVDDSGAVLRDLSQYVTEVDGFEKAFEALDVTGLGQAQRRRVVGLEGATITIRGIFDDTATTGPHAVFSGIVGGDTERTVTYGPGGKTTGKVRFTVEAKCFRYRLTGPVGEAIGYEAEMQSNGAVTIDTFP